MANVSEKSRNKGKTHGLYYHPLHSVWANMKGRCYNRNDQDYKNYGGRGVVVCEEWRHSFEAFYNWCIGNGWRQGLHLDKDLKSKQLGVVSNLHSPERCTFVTPRTNSNNRRNNRIIEHNGITRTLAEWSHHLGINSGTLLSRIDESGWSIEKALNTPTRKRISRKE